MKAKYHVEIGYYEFFGELTAAEVAALTTVFSKLIEVKDRRYLDAGFQPVREESKQAQLKISTLPRSAKINEQLVLMERTEE